MNNLAATLRRKATWRGRASCKKKCSTSSVECWGRSTRIRTSMNNLAETLREQGDLAGRGKLNEETLAINRRVLGPEHPDTLTSMNSLAADASGAR